MMRPIKFRGKTNKGNWKGNWVYGNLSILEKALGNIKPGFYISSASGSPFAHKVLPETVGQFTGRLDENKAEIYQGDIWHGKGVMNIYYIVDWDKKEACFRFLGSLGNNVMHVPSMKHSEEGSLVDNLHDIPRDVADFFKTYTDEKCKHVHELKTKKKGNE